MSGVRTMIRNLRRMERVQALIGRAMAAYQNDKARDRERAVMQPLREAFDLMVELRGPLPAAPPSAGETT